MQTGGGKVSILLQFVYFNKKCVLNQLTDCSSAYEMTEDY